MNFGQHALDACNDGFELFSLLQCLIPLVLHSLVVTVHAAPRSFQPRHFFLYICETCFYRGRLQLSFAFSSTNFVCAIELAESRCIDSASSRATS